MTESDTAALELLASAPAPATPRCEGRWECPERCCPPQPCQYPAGWRVTFACATPACGHAAHVLLLCGICAAASTDTRRRPL